MLIDTISSQIFQGDSNILIEASVTPPLDTAQVERYGDPDPRLNEGIRSTAVLSDLREKGRRPATYDELMRYAECHPEAQLKCYIVALGELFLSDKEYVAVLCSVSGVRTVAAVKVDLIFGGHFGFLSFPIEPPCTRG